MNQRSNALAERLEQDARALADFAQGLSEQAVASPHHAERTHHRGRRPHVANIYPLEIQLAQLLAGGKPIEGVAWSNVHELNANHAVAFAAATPAEAIALLEQNSAAAAAAIRALDDTALDRAAAVSLYDHAPLSCQFFLEDHAVRTVTTALPRCARRWASRCPLRGALCVFHLQSPLRLDITVNTARTTRRVFLVDVTLAAAGALVLQLAMLSALASCTDDSERDRRRSGEERMPAFTGEDQRGDFCAQHCIRAARPIDERGAPRGLELERGVQQRLEHIPSVA